MVIYFNFFLSFFLSLVSPLALLNLHPKAPPVPQFMNSGHLSVRQRRMMGKWVFGCQIGSLCGLLFLLLLLNMAVVWTSTRGVVHWVKWGICWGGCVLPEKMTPWGWAFHCSLCDWVCHHGDRQSDRHIEESVAVLPSVPPPSPCLSHHTETPGTRMLPLCSRTC